MMTATACPSAEHLREFSLGRLPETESDDLFDHLRNCETCKSELETLSDNEDSLIASLRSPDALAGLSDEPNCRVAIAKALGALAAVGEAPSTADMSLLPEKIGEYELVRPLGRGGMGSVYVARHTKLGREVALKVLATHRLADKRMRERFEGEMRAVGQLSHPNIVTAHDARELDETAVLVTEYIDGLDLGKLVARTGPLEIADACEIIRQVALALQYTSDQGFVHRDVKPSNIMLSSAGEVKLLDLGLARFQSASGEGIELTGTGQAMGTADYVAPEQVTDSRSVDVRADIYALGCTLFKLITGTAPFAADQYPTAFAKMTAHVSSEPPSLGTLRDDAPARLVKLVDAMFSKDPDARPQTPQSVAEKLSVFTSGANLPALSQLAESLQPDHAAANGQRTSSPSTVARSRSWLHRRVPMAAAIGAGFFGLLLGLCMGVLIEIKYPDGTTVAVAAPEGSEVTVRQAADEPAVTHPQDAQALAYPPAEGAPAEQKIKSSLREIGLAFHKYHDTHGNFPGSTNQREGAIHGRHALTGEAELPAYGRQTYAPDISAKEPSEEVDELAAPDKAAYPFSWRVAILPFLEDGAYEQLYERYRFDEPWDSEANLKLLEQMPVIYRNPFAPSDQPVGHMNYQGFATGNSALGKNGGIPFREMRDGTANTLLLIETKGSVPWTKPQDIEGNPEFFDDHPVHFVMTDGSVHAKETIDQDLLRKIITRDGGERVQLDR